MHVVTRVVVKTEHGLADTTVAVFRNLTRIVSPPITRDDRTTANRYADEADESWRRCERPVVLLQETLRGLLCQGNIGRFPVLALQNCPDAVARDTEDIGYLRDGVRTSHAPDLRDLIGGEFRSVALLAG